MNFLYNLFIEFLAKYHISSNIGAAVFSCLPFLVVITGIIFSVLIMVLAERKLLGYFTQRKGPNRVGIWGILQTTADGIKILCKENITPQNVDKILFNVAPPIMFSAITLLWCIIPYNSEFIFFNSNLSLPMFYIISVIPVIFIFLAGYSSHNKFSALGAYRSIILFVSYTIPFLLVILSIICIANTMNLNTIIQSQANIWFCFYNIIGFIIFYICLLAKLHRCPFDISEAESELVCGFHTEYSGMRFAMFFLGEYAELIVLSMFTVILFLGGYLPPFNLYLSNILSTNCTWCKYLIYFEQTFWLLLKTAFVIFSIIWVRATLPRIKQENIINVFWKYLTPAAFINLILIIMIFMR